MLNALAGITQSIKCDLMFGAVFFQIIDQQLGLCVWRFDASGGVDMIYLVGNQFVSMMVQEPTTTRLLPLEIVEEETASEDIFPLYEFEPEVDKVLDTLLPVYIENRIYNKMLQSAAAEHAARQKAMKSATDNADKLILNYTRLANQARQAEITQQISEIVGGADALSTVSED